MSKEEKKLSCSIVDFLERNNQKVFDVVKNLCLIASLKSRRGADVAFVIPSDAVLDSVAKMAMSDSEKTVEEAQNIMNAHILNGDPKEDKANTSSRLRILIGVQSVAGNVITLENGTKLTADGAFRLMPKRAGMAVYRASGPMPLTGKEAPMAARKPRGEVAGKGEASGGNDNVNRMDLLNKVINNPEFANQKNGNIFLVAVLSLMAHLKGKESYNRALVSLDWSPYATFFLLLEPGKASNHLVPDADLAGWNGEGAAVTGADAIKQYEALMKEAVGQLKGGIKMVDSMVDDLRWDIVSRGISKNTLMGSIDAAYTPSAISNMYNDAAVGAFMAENKYKQWQDEARFHINYMVTYWEMNIMEHKHDFDSIVATVLAVMGSDKPLFNATMAANKIVSTAEFLTGPVAFVESHSFMYYPVDGVTGRGEDDADGGDLAGDYGGNREGVMEASGAGSGKHSTLEGCACMV